MSLQNIEFKNAKSEIKKLSDYPSKAYLVVNVASECGFTNQYEGLQKLFEQYESKGLMILGFPCNQFGGQEPGTDDEIQGFCSGRFGVRFPVLSKIDVNGKDAHPLYVELKKIAPGILGTEAIKWNFTKFLVSDEGRIVKRFAPNDKPEDLVLEIEKALA